MLTRPRLIRFASWGWGVPNVTYARLAYFLPLCPGLRRGFLAESQLETKATPTALTRRPSRGGNGNAWCAKSINWTTKIGRQTLIPLITRLIGSSSSFTDSVSIPWIAKFRNAPRRRSRRENGAIIARELIFACSILRNRVGPCFKSIRADEEWDEL